MQVIYFTLLLKVLILLISNANGQHSHGKPVAIQFIENEDTDEDYQFNFDGLREILEHPEVKDRSVVIVSVIGAYRGGKSFFLGYCLRFLYANYRSVNTLNQTFVKNGSWWGGDDEPLAGFSWKHGMEGDTKGILIWSDIFLHEQNDEKIAIILMDTQGLFELEADANLDARVFGITSLISSIQILNIRGYIQENQLEYLKMVTDFAKLAAERQGENVIANKTKAFQQLLFLFRDWEDKKTGYGYEGGAKYLQRFLATKRTRNKIAQSVRKNIKESYGKMDAMLLPHPGRIISEIDYDGRWGPLDNDFKEYFKNLIESIFLPENLVKKKFFDNDMTAQDMIKYATVIFGTFKRAELPDVDSIFNLTLSAEVNKLVDDAVNEYIKIMTTRLDYSRENFISIFFDDHKLTQMAVLEMFRQRPKMSDEKTEKNAEKIILAKIDDFFINWKVTVLNTHTEYTNDKIRKEEAEKRAIEELRLRAEIKREAEQKRLASLFQGHGSQPVHHHKPNIACKIFTFGIGRC